jgi:hypothetical protein
VKAKSSILVHLGSLAEEGEVGFISFLGDPIHHIRHWVRTSDFPRKVPFGIIEFSQ